MVSEALSGAYFDEGFVSFTAAPQLVVEQLCPKLPVLVLDVVLHGRLARSAELVGLFQVVFVHFNFFVIVVLKSHKASHNYLWDAVTAKYYISFQYTQVCLSCLETQNHKHCNTAHFRAGILVQPFDLVLSLHSLIFIHMMTA